MPVRWLEDCNLVMSSGRNRRKSPTLRNSDIECSDSPLCGESPDFGVQVIAWRVSWAGKMHHGSLYKLRTQIVAIA